MRTLNPNTLERVENYITEYQKKNGKSPSYRQIMHGVGMSSLNLVQRYVLALEREGRIERTRIGNISVPPKLKPSGVAIAPLVGSIACGQPVDAVENIEESFALPRSIFGNGDLFMLRTFGDSMIDIGIKKDDLVVIRKQNTADDGEIVVAMINGETTLKRIFRRNGKVILHPENKEMKDIVVKDCEICKKIGSVGKGKGEQFPLYKRRQRTCKDKPDGISTYRPRQAKNNRKFFRFRSFSIYARRRSASPAIATDRNGN